jgi:hypothetical protein
MGNLLNSPRAVEKRLYYQANKGRWREYRRANKDRINRRRKELYALNPDPIRRNAAEYRSKNRELINARQREISRRNPGRWQAYERKRRYGILPEQLQKLRAAQNDQCAICLSPLTDSLAVDHCHRSGVIRGLLCRNCNSGIGLLNDDSERAYRAAVYLTPQIAVLSAA